VIEFVIGLAKLSGNLKQVCGRRTVQRGMANAVMVGEMNIRQLRVRAESCRPSTSVLHNCRCFSLYSEASRDNSTFGVHRTYHYHTAKQTGATVYRGQFGLYGGDGYLWSFPAGYERYDFTELTSSLYRTSVKFYICGSLECGLENVDQWFP